MYTIPLATAGEEETSVEPPPLLDECHSGVQVASPAHEAGNANRSRSAEPTYTTPPATAGEE